MSTTSNPSIRAHSAAGVDSPSSTHHSKSQTSPKSWLSGRVLFEIVMAWKITVGDFPTTVIPYLCAGASTFLVAEHPVRDVPLLLLKIIIYGFLYIYAFATVNQLGCIDEDRTNKPRRPLAQGLITRQWMIRRAVATNILFVTYGFLLSIPWPTLTWLALIHLHTIRGIYRHWFFKNIVFISVGAGVEITAVWGLILPTAALPWQWICLTSLLVGIGCNCQDIRDVAGDRLADRKTMSIAWGENNGRIASVLLLYAIPMIQYAALPWPQSSAALLVSLGMPCALIWTSATRFLFFQNPRSDHWSYQLFAFWWCSVLLLQPLTVTGHI